MLRVQTMTSTSPLARRSSRRPVRRLSVAAPFSPIGPRHVRLQFFGEQGPDLVAAVTVARAVRRAVYVAAEERLGPGLAPDELHGPPPGSPDDGRHLHAFWLPEDLDEDMVIDHISVVVPGGISPLGLRVLADTDEVIADGLGAWGLTPDLIADAPGPTARRWRSTTPFVAPLIGARRAGEPTRPKFALKAQLEKILDRFRQPDHAPLPEREIRFLGQDCPITGVRADAFRFGAHNTQRRRPEAGYFEIVFAEPTPAPLALGLEGHFGLGRFEPAD